MSHGKLYVNTIYPNTGTKVSISASLAVSGNLEVGDTTSDSVTVVAPSKFETSITASAHISGGLNSNIQAGTGSFEKILIDSGNNNGIWVMGATPQSARASIRLGNSFFADFHIGDENYLRIDGSGTKQFEINKDKEAIDLSFSKGLSSSVKDAIQDISRGEKSADAITAYGDPLAALGISNKDQTFQEFQQEQEQEKSVDYFDTPAPDSISQEVATQQAEAPTSTPSLSDVYDIGFPDSGGVPLAPSIPSIPTVAPKIAAEVADLNGYGTFDVVVRRVNNTNIPNSPYGQIDDTDTVPVILEAFRNVNLDPTSVRYISRVIGDRFQTVTDAGDLLINGDYPNLSKFIRVSVDAGVSEGTNDKSLIPFGFRAPESPIPNILLETSASININVNFASASYVTSQTPAGGSHDAVNYHGFDFTNYNNLNYLAPIPSTSNTTGSNADFYLGDVTQDSAANFPTLTAPYSGSLQDSLAGGTFTTNVATATRKFIVPMQGGFDGAKPNLKKYSGEHITAANTFGHDCSTSTSTGTKAYNKAFTLLENTDFYDINMLITPGIIDSLHSSVTTKARNLVEARQDTFYVMDTNALSDSISTVEAQVTTLDNNYTAAYWPWLKITNPDGNLPQWVPPSVIVPGALAFNDAVSAPWYAPAGLNRGALTSVSDTYITLKQKQRDTLYEARVNPIANFPNDGICIWGQKTLQARPSALDRVNVRRLLIAVKKFIASSTKFLVFEQNTAATRNAFLSIVNPYLEQVKQNQGLSAFRVVMDSTNNTPETIDQNILYGQLFLQPTRTAEFIILDFNIQATGASFPE